MKEKQLIERNLPFNQKYIYLEIIKGNLLDGQFCTCNNCGKLITNMVKVVNKETKQYFTIGIDCAETLAKVGSLLNNGSQTDFYLDIYSYNKTLRFATELKKGKKYESNGFMLYVLNDKNKQIDCFLHDLQKFFPDLIQ